MNFHNKNCVKCFTRPNLSQYSDLELLDIINEYEPEFESNTEYFREHLIAKIFSLWSSYVLEDNNSQPIECLICWDNLTNGNNMSFECGHKFHSSCIVKNLLIFSTDTYITKMGDKEIENFNIEFLCPQCKKSIDSIEFTKDNIDDK